MLRKIIEQIADWLEQKQANVKAWLAQARYKLHHFPETNYDLGVRFAARGKLHDAIFRFQMALKARPGWADAYYQQGLCHMRLEKFDKAAQDFAAALQHAPTHQDARYLLAVVAPERVPADKMPTSMPAHMVQGFFQEIAPNYAAIEKESNYQAPVKMVEALRPLLPSLSELYVMDAGCGMGHLAMRWRKVASHLIGVDVTPGMVEQAKAAYTASGDTLFDEVFEGDIRALSQYAPAGSQDVVLCGNVLQFVGALEGFFHEAAQCLKPSGLLAITVEPYTPGVTGKGFGIVRSSARFGHHITYIQQVAADCGFAVVKQEKTNLYPEMPAHIIVLQKQAKMAAPTSLPDHEGAPL